VGGNKVPPLAVPLTGGGASALLTVIPIFGSLSLHVVLSLQHQSTKVMRFDSLLPSMHDRSALGFAEDVAQPNQDSISKPNLNISEVARPSEAIELDCSSFAIQAAAN